MTSNSSLTYRDAGVDIDTGNALIERIKPAVASTTRSEVLSGLGGFGALFELPLDRYKKPVLVSGTDGVGTKLKLAIELNKHDTVGIDLVAMCVNDVIVTGAEPLFFLDYYAAGKLDIDAAEAVIGGIAAGCKQAGAALIGGETAELPGMYAAGDYDLAGFCVGIVEKDAVIDGSKVRPGDDIIGLASSGPHSNGYSLVRKIIGRANASAETVVDGRNLFEQLIAPTRIYVKSILALIDVLPIHAIAHITGGGLLENIPRVLKNGIQAEIDQNTWQWPAVFSWLADQGKVASAEMYRTFNCGIGMVVCVAPDDTQTALSVLAEHGETVSVIGKVASGSNGIVIST